MLEVMMVLTVLNTAVAVAALVIAVVERRSSAPSQAALRNDEESEEKPFKLSDKKMQEGINNLLGYEVGGKSGGDEE